MQPQQKTSQKGFYGKSKSYNTQNYPYTTDETPPSHYSSYKQNNPYKHNKNKKYSNDSTNYQSASEQYVQSNRANTQPNENNSHSHQSYGYKDKWQHDKYNDDKQGNHPPENTYNYPRNSRKNKNKGEKKPDRQLYSARDKHVHGEDAKSESTNTETMTSLPNKEESLNPDSSSLNNLNDGPQEVKLIHGDAFENKESLMKTNMVKGLLGIVEDKEGAVAEEDKSFLSTVSTALSERLKNHDEENIIMQNKPVLPVELLPKKSEPRVLLQFIIKSDHLHEKIRIFEDEEDYGGLLDKICRNHNFMGRMSLYFRINFLKMICDQQREKSFADTLLQKYVDLNAKLVLYDCRLREAHESIKPYLVSDQFANYSMMPINAPPNQQMHQMHMNNMNMGMNVNVNVNVRNMPGLGHNPIYTHMPHHGKQNMNQQGGGGPM